MKANLVIYVVAGVVILAIAGGVYFLSIQSTETASESGANQTTTEQLPEEYTDYLETVTEQIAEGEYGVPVNTEVTKPTPQNVDNGKWALTVPFNSLNSDLFLLEDNGQTPWMDHVRFDAALTEFEKNEKENLLGRTADWQAIIGNPTTAQQMVAKIQNEFVPYWKDLLAYYQEQRNTRTGVEGMFATRFGTGTSNIPAKYLSTYQHIRDEGFILDDLIGMADLNLKIKEQTVKGVQNKDVRKCGGNRGK